MNSAAPNWYPDPYGRYQQRYFDGTNWTAHVADAAGTQSTDAAPLGGSAPASQQPAQQAGGWGQQQPAQQQPAQQQGQWGAQQYSPPPQQQPGGWSQPQQQPPAQQFQQPTAQYGQQPAQQPGGGFGAPGYGQQPTGGSSSTMTKNFVGVIVAGVGALVLIVSLFALNWVSGDAAEESGGIDRSEISDAIGDVDDAREQMRAQADSVPESSREEFQDVYDSLDVGFFSSSFFGFGWIIALLVGLGGVAAALFKVPVARFAAAAVAVVCAIWALIGAMGMPDVLEGFAEVAGFDASLSVGIGAWLAVLGLLAVGAGAIVAHFQDQSTT